MYETFYRLIAEPFRLSPDPAFCFQHRSYARAKAYMQYAFNRAEGFVMVTGRPGTGKTTLIGDLVKSLPRTQVSVGTLVTPQLEAEDLLQMVAHAFGMSVPPGGKAHTLQYLTTLFRRERQKRRRALLIIDEAQDLSAAALEELRLLTNLNENGQPLLQIFLVGQENLQELVHEKNMEQVFQRIIAACHLKPLNEEETREYVLYRLQQAGWRHDPLLSESLFPIIHRFSEGIPRRINLICGRLLLHGAVERKHRLGVEDARLVVAELHVERLTDLNVTADAVFDQEDRFEQPPRFTPPVEPPAAPERARRAEKREPTPEAAPPDSASPDSTVPHSSAEPGQEERPSASGEEERQNAEKEPFFPLPEEEVPTFLQEKRGHSWLWWLGLLILLLAGLALAWYKGLLG